MRIDTIGIKTKLIRDDEFRSKRERHTVESPVCFNCEHCFFGGMANGAEDLFICCLNTPQNQEKVKTYMFCSSWRHYAEVIDEESE